MSKKIKDENGNVYVKKHLSTRNGGLFCLWC